jgi:ribosomal protein S18 acetylase RimI-like enzyme
MSKITIRKATPQDADAVWEVFHNVVQSGTTFTYMPDTSRSEVEDSWKADPRARYVAEVDGRVWGFYDLKPNQRGLGSHIANAGYMVHPAMHSKGLGSALIEHSLNQAKEQGYKAMQYNMVVSTNAVAIKYYDKLGFTKIGTIPKAFNHAEKGLVDAYIMYKEL